MKYLVSILSCSFLWACQSTDSTLVDDTPLQLTSLPAQQPNKIKLNKPSTIDMPNINIAEVPDVESIIAIPQKKNNKQNTVDKSKLSQLLNDRFVNTQVCRDNVSVTYKVTNPNGVKGNYHAKVQVQGLIIDISYALKHIKLETTGWYSNNANLQLWRPYLDSLPLAKDARLGVGDTFWNNPADWYACEIKSH